MLGKIKNAVSEAASKVKDAASSVKETAEEKVNAFKEAFMTSFHAVEKAVAPAGMGQRGQVVSTIMTIAIAGITLVVTLYVFGSVGNLIENLNSSDSPITSIIDSVYDAFNMAPIIFIVLIAGLVISVLMRWTNGGNSRR